MSGLLGHMFLCVLLDCDLRGPSYRDFSVLGPRGARLRDFSVLGAFFRAPSSEPFETCYARLALRDRQFDIFFPACALGADI